MPPSQGSVPAPERFPPSARPPVGAVIWLGCLMATKSLQEFWALHLHPSLLRAREVSVSRSLGLRLARPTWASHCRVRELPCADWLSHFSSLKKSLWEGLSLSCWCRPIRAIHSWSSGWGDHPPPHSATRGWAGEPSLWPRPTETWMGGGAGTASLLEGGVLHAGDIHCPGLWPRWSTWRPQAPERHACP